jgi:transcriptional regulator with XRE-family HTH domain
MRLKPKKGARPPSKRKKPERLAEKLLAIRKQLELSQGGIIKHLGLEDEIERDYISKFERGILEPTLNVLLAYARAISTTGGGEFLEALIDDELDLPEKMPADPSVRMINARRSSALGPKKWVIAE